MLELAFESALVVHLLVELRAHPVGLVEDLKAQPAALRTALGRGGQARLVQLRGRNADARAIGREVKGNLRLRPGSGRIWRASSGRDRRRACASRGAARTRAARPRPAPATKQERIAATAESGVARGRLRPGDTQPPLEAPIRTAIRLARPSGSLLAGSRPSRCPFCRRCEVVSTLFFRSARGPEPVRGH